MRTGWRKRTKNQRVLGVLLLVCACPLSLAAERPFSPRRYSTSDAYADHSAAGKYFQSKGKHKMAIKAFRAAA